MIKGIWWQLVVLLLAESLWIASCLNSQYRQKRQMNHPIFGQRLRNTRYLVPIPVRIPQYYKEQSEHITRDSPKTESASPWIPVDVTARALPSRNVYVPPLRPPSIIVTRKPLKTSFNVPLTKSIQVSPAKPNIQTVGYIRKHLVKIPTSRATKTPRPKTLGTLVESTVHSLLNFTPTDEGWRPKVLTTPVPAVVPNQNFNKKVNPNFDTHLINDTGTTHQQARLKTVSENQPLFGVAKNNTNFALKFSPEDIRDSSKNKTDKVDVTFYPSSFEGKHFNGNQEFPVQHSDESVDSEKLSSNLWKEKNYPYQGHKSSQQKAHVENNGAPNDDTTETYSDWKDIYDSFQNAQNLKTDIRKKYVMQSQNHGSFVNDPYNAEIFNSDFINNKRIRNQNTGLFPKQIYGVQDDKNVQTVFPNSHEDSQTFRLETSKANNGDINQQVSSNLPYQRHPTVSIKPFQANLQYPSENIRDNRYQTKQVPSSTHNTSAGSIKKIENESNNKHIYDNRFNPSLINEPHGNDVNNSFVDKVDSVVSKISPGNGNFKLNSMSNNYKSNNTIPKDKIVIAEIPLAVGDKHNMFKSPSSRTDLTFKNANKSHDSTNNQNTRIYVSSPKLQGFVPMYNHNFSLLQKNQNIRLIADTDNSENTAFVLSPKLKEVELKNPPEHLEFDDDDFLKPIVPIHFHENNDSNKKLSTFKFSARDRSGEINKSITPVNKKKEKILVKTSTEVPISKVEYHENSKFGNKKPSKETLGNVYFQPVFPEVSLNSRQATSTHKFQNYNNDQSSRQVYDNTKGDAPREKSSSDLQAKEISKSYDTSREKSKINIDDIVTKNTNYSQKETKRNNIQTVSNHRPRIVTSPPVITMKYEPGESGISNTRDSTNRSDTYVIQRKPSLLPESSNHPKKPKIILSTGMLAGILIAALIFLAFLTGSMVYAFHQWKFGRKKKDRQKKQTTRSPRFPPEYLDENFAGNTYIHNNIFLPMPQNVEDRNSTEPDTSSMTGDEVSQESTSTSARVRRHPGIYRESREE